MTDQDTAYEWDDTDDGAEWEDSEDYPGEGQSPVSGPYATFTPPSDDGETRNGNGNGQYYKSHGSRDILDAPPYATFVKITDTRVAREYRTKTQSMLKGIALGAIRLGDLPDAAAIFHYGPDFSIAVGQLAETNETTRKAVDLLTSPDNPVVVFAMAAIPFVTQLIRNNQQALADIPKTRRQRRKERAAAAASGIPEPSVEFTVPFTKFKVRSKLRVKLRLARVLGGFMRNSTDPRELTHTVFSDDALLKALVKHGIRIQREESGNG